MKKTTVLLLILGLAFGYSCKKQKSGKWLIPKDEVLDGGPGKDGIPALDNPIWIPAAEDTYMQETDLVMGYASGGEAWAFPHNVLNWHEIVNENLNSNKLAVIYCPLTGTGLAWSRIVNGTETTFGVSGLLYNTNVIPYDRGSDSNWSQLRFDCVNGDLSGTKAENIQLIETSWETWKEMYPGTMIISENTGYPRDYTHYPYSDYITNHDVLLYPVANEDSRLQRKERVLGVFAGSSMKAYDLKDFSDTISVITDTYQSIPLAVCGSEAMNFILAFDRRAEDGTELTLSPVQDALPVVMTDTEGNEWDVWGNCISGPRLGEQLNQPHSLMGYWFAFAAFYPDLDLYE